jgi:hypothetical protein
MSLQTVKPDKPARPTLSRRQFPGLAALKCEAAETVLKQDLPALKRAHASQFHGIG